MKKPYILITNDDGIQASGIRNLISFLKPMARLLIVAPDKGHSGQSHAVTVGEPIRVKLLKEEPDYLEYSCTGTPVDCVKLALQQICTEKPDLVVSGINHGNNGGINVLYSGTMGAAFEGTINGCMSIGFSLNSYAHDADFSGCEHSIVKIVNKALNGDYSKEIALNVNIPAVPDKEINGINICRQAKGRWVEEFDKRVDPFGEDYYWLTGEYLADENEKYTDQWALENNFVSIVPQSVDLTHYESFHKYNK